MYRFYSEPNQPVRVTVVGLFADGRLYTAVSRCSTKDNFIRKKGRMIAEGRLVKGKIYKSFEMSTCTSAEFVAVAKSIIPEVIKSKYIG